MTWCIYGAGAIGGVIAARLALAGEEVALVARGAQLAAIRERGLVLRDPEGDRTLPLPVHKSAAGVGLRAGDTVLLAVKSQDTAAALADLAAAAPAGVRVVCLQNGVDNERQALRYFDDVYGAAVTLLASFTEPGVVVAHSAPLVGILQLGRAPGGADAAAEQLAGTLRSVGIRVDVTDDVMPYKNLKLLRNLGNAIEIVCSGAAPTLLARATAEGERVLAAAGAALPGPAEDVPGPEPVHPAVPRLGGSTLQSVVRNSGSVETDYLNGEVALLGRLHGIPTPANALLQRLAREVGAGTLAARSLDESDLLARIGG